MTQHTPDEIPQVLGLVGLFISESRELQSKL